MLEMDVTRPLSIQQGIDRILSEQGRIDILIKKKRPPFRTKTGPVEQVLFACYKGWLPDRLVAWVVRKGYNK